jgi:RUN domain
VQAWLYASLNGSVLAQRLQTLSVLRTLLSDWYFPWALVRQEDRLTDFLTELVKVSRWAVCMHVAAEAHAAAV